MTPFHKKALIFFQHNPFPPRTGAHQRCLAVIKALRQLNCEVILFSSSLHTDTTWKFVDRSVLEREHGIHIEVFEPQEEDILYAAQFRWDDIHREQWGRFASDGLSRAFTRYAKQFKPDVVIVNYTFFGKLIADPFFRNTLTIMESLDMFSLSMQMQKHLNACLPPPPIAPAQTPSFLLNEDMLRDFHLDIWPEEYAMCDLYDISVMVSPAETRAVGEHTRSTRVVRIPITAEAVDLDNTYLGTPVYLAARNMLNVQGYLYFARKVLPLILASAKDFSMDVIGSCCQHVESVKGLKHRGYVDSLADIYRDTPFTICPLLGATGQQIKVVESMAHGIPVIVHQNVSESSPVIDGVNGLIARNPEEFAACCLRLYKDRTLCRKLGETARATITDTCSQDTLTREFSKLLAFGQQRRQKKPLPKTNSRKSKKTVLRPEKPFLSVLVDCRSNAHRLHSTLDSIIQMEPFPSEILLFGPLKQTHNFPVLIRPVSSYSKACLQLRGQWMTILQAGDHLDSHTAGELSKLTTVHPNIDVFQSRPAFCNEVGRLTWVMEQPPTGNQSVELWSRRAGLFWRSSKWPAPQPTLTPELYSAQLVQMLMRGSLWAMVETLWGAGLPDGRSGKFLTWPETNQRLLAVDSTASEHLARHIRSIHCADGMELLENIVQEREKILESLLKQKKLQISFLEQLVRTRWQNLSASSRKITRVVLFGAGTHTHWLLPIIRDLPDPTIAAILDDQAHRGMKISGIPVYKPDGFDFTTIDAVVLSTDCHQELMTKRCRALFGPRIPIVYPYDNLPMGPYPKK